VVSAPGGTGDERSSGDTPSGKRGVEDSLYINFLACGEDEMAMSRPHPWCWSCRAVVKTRYLPRSVCTLGKREVATTCWPSERDSDGPSAACIGSLVKAGCLAAASSAGDGTRQNRLGLTAVG